MARCSLFADVWGIKIHFGNHKHYPNCWWQSVLMCCVMSADASAHDDLFGQWNHMRWQLQRHTHKKEAGWCSVSLPRECLYLRFWHDIVFWLCLRLTSASSADSQARVYQTKHAHLPPDRRHARNRLLSLPFLLSVTCDYICWCHPPRVSLL